MNCAECEKLLPEFACGSLAPAELADVRRHLSSGCQHCAHELERWRETLSALALAAPTQTPPARVRSALLARVRADLQSPVSVARDDALSAPKETRKRAFSWRFATPYIAATLCAIVAGVAAVRWTDQRLETQAALERDFARRMAEARQTFQSPHVRLAAFGRSDSNALIDGQLIWDSVAGEVHFYAFNLGLPSTDSHFELWFVNATGDWISVGQLAPTANGNCTALLDLPSRPTEIVRAVVTEEPNASNTASLARPRGPERMIADFANPPAE